MIALSRRTPRLLMLNYAILNKSVIPLKKIKPQGGCKTPRRRTETVRRASVTKQPTKRMSFFSGMTKLIEEIDTNGKADTV